MAKTKDLIIELSVAVSAFLMSYISAAFGLYYLSGAVLILTGCFFFAAYLRKSGRYINPAAFFSISWIGGAGVSALKLSFLQTNWSNTTWISFLLIFLCFLLCYRMTGFLLNYRTSGPKTVRKYNEISHSTEERNGLLIAIVIVLILSVSAFLLEVRLLEYIPLFTVDTPHAYSYFHVSGVHYFTVSFVLIPSLSVIYIRSYSHVSDIPLSKRILLSICIVIALLLPILLVSRFQLIFAVLLAVFTTIGTTKMQICTLKSPRFWLTAISGFALMLILYVFLTVQRAHSIEYLNGIFEMKNNAVPIFVTQPYIYIANNYDNFNCLVEQLPEHTHGLRMLFPVFALTGMKFSHPELVSFPIYITKEELTTVTLFYDAFYDFGVFGVCIMAAILGALSGWMEHFVGKNTSNFAFFFLYIQLCFYLLFAFFTTWFSNPTTWFYIIATISIGIFVQVYTKLLAHRNHV